MSSRLRIAGICVVATSLWACGGAPPQPVTTAPANGVIVDDEPGGSGNAKMAESEGMAANVAPVASPGELVLHFRWKNPGETLATAASFANLPPGFINSNLRTVVREALQEAVGGSIDASKMADVVSLDAPIDAVGVADISRAGQVPEPMFAWSIGLTSLQRALAASNGRPEKIADGVWRLGGKDSWGSPCAVAAAAGKTPARLVCAERSRDLAIAAYVARNVATMPEPAADMHAEIRLRGLLDKYGRMWANQARGLPVLAEELKLDIPSFDEALKDTAEALADEAGAVLADADSIAVDITVNQQKGVQLTFEAAFAGKRSWLVQTMLDGSHLAGPPPEILWVLPKSTEAFAWGHSADPARFAPVLAAGRSLLLGFMQHEKVGSAADRQAIGKLLRLPTKKYVGSVSASGHFSATPAKAGKAAFADMLDGVVGWHVVGMEDSSAEVKSYLTDMVNVYNRPSLQGMMKKEMGSDAKHLPRVKITRAPQALGAGSMEVEVTIPQVEDPTDAMGLGAPPVAGPPPQPKTIDVKMHILLMADGQRTWMGLAGNRDELAKLMATLKGKGPADSLATRSELAGLKRGKHSAGSVTSLDGALGVLKPMVMGFMASAPAGVAGPGQQVLTMFERLPNKGKTPITAYVDVDAGAKPRTSMTMTVPRETLDDIGFVIQGIMQLASQP